MDEEALSFDSPEEEWFAWYLEELQEAGYISWYGRAPTYVLFTPVRRSFLKIQEPTKAGKLRPDLYPDKNWLNDHVYTPDFEVVWTEKALQDHLVQPWTGNLVPASVGTDLPPYLDPRIPLICGPQTTLRGRSGWHTVVEVKPFFDRHGKTARASSEIKWTLQKYDEYVQLLKVGSFARQPKAGIFAETFTPSRYLKTAKTAKERKIHHRTKSLSEWLVEHRALFPAPAPSTPEPT